MIDENEPTRQTITLHSGRLFDLASPESSDFTVEDIAHGLAHICRYVGQCNGFYSVAEHSVLVSQVAPRAKLAALLHDAVEAFTGDISGPLKLLVPEFRTIEKRIEQVVFERLGIDWPPPPEVKRADDSVMVAEQQKLMPAETTRSLESSDVCAADVIIRQLDPPAAKKVFLHRFAELKATSVCGAPARQS